MLKHNIKIDINDIRDGNNPLDIISKSIVQYLYSINKTVLIFAVGKKDNEVACEVVTLLERQIYYLDEKATDFINSFGSIPIDSFEFKISTKKFPKVQIISN